MFIIKDLLFVVLGIVVGWFCFSPIEEEEEIQEAVPPMPMNKSPLLRAAAGARSGESGH